MGGDRSWRDPDRRHRRDLLPAAHQAAGPAHRRHHRRQCRGRAAASLIYTETVEKRGRSLVDFVGLVSANAAKIMGLYPRKGALAVGSDADIVVLDPRRRHVVRAAEMHEADYSPWEGRDLAAWPSLTMLRGKIVVEGGTFAGDLKDGQFLPRKVPDEVRTRPAV